MGIGEEKKKSVRPESDGTNAINKIEIPIQPSDLKIGLRLQIDVQESKVRLQVQSLARWS